MVNEKSTLTIDINTDVKEVAADFLERMGLDVATAVELFFRQIITERRLPFQPMVAKTLDEQLEEAFWNCDSEMIEVDFDEDDNILIDKDKHPSLYDWAVNG